MKALFLLVFPLQEVVHIRMQTSTVISLVHLLIWSALLCAAGSPSQPPLPHLYTCMPHPAGLPLPCGHWYPVPFCLGSWQITPGCHYMGTRFLFWLNSETPTFPLLTCGNPPYSAHECVPRPVILMSEKNIHFMRLRNCVFTNFSY